MISILIPAFNAEKYIAPAVASASQQIHQTEVEILVCDDCSSDGTAGVLEEIGSQTPGLRVFTHSRNQGVSAARNTLLANISPGSQFVAFFDADDVYVDGGLGKLWSLLRDNPELDMAHGKMQVVPSSVLETGDPIGDEWPSLHGVTLSASMFRRQVVSRAGMFNTSLSHGEDLDYLLRIAELCRGRLLVDDTIFHYRRHGANATNNALQTRRGTMHALLLHSRRLAANPNLQDVRGLVSKIDPEIMARIAEIHD